MRRGRPSRTAQGAALHRAVHQIVDAPPVFFDPLAGRIVGRVAARRLAASDRVALKENSAGLRAFVAARSRLAEDSLAEARAKGVAQYLVLGAGLDIFAYRHPHDAELRIFEADHPATQAWKRARLSRAQIAAPGILVYAPVDLEHETIEDGLKRAGFDFEKPAVIAWLGVAPYLTREAIFATFSFVAELAKGTQIVFDYATPPDQAAPESNAAFEAMAARVARVGEPFRSFFTAEELRTELLKHGFSTVEDFDTATLNARYFAGRDDGLRLRGRGRITRATV